ncbi:MAG: M23 family metallopeptidase [Kouleothrix sp.]|nr:M23 family metallopeptidase [Kouleothrix sp.]
MSEQRAAPQIETLPRRLFFSSLPTGDQEFSCFIRLQGGQASDISMAGITWSIAERGAGRARLAATRAISAEEAAAGRAFVSAVLPPGWHDSLLRVELQTNRQVYADQWPIERYRQARAFQLPLAGQILVLVGHRVGETHRAAWQIPSQQFAWDLLPLDPNGLRLLTGALADPLLAQDFVGFGQAVLSPAAGRVARVADGYPDGAHVGAYPDDLRYYLEDLRRAAGNHVVVDHGDGVYSCLSHLQSGSIGVREQQVVEAGHVLGALGSSGFSSGPHLHLHFMDGPDMLTAAALPIALEAEGSTFAPQAGQIIGR